MYLADILRGDFDKKVSLKVLYNNVEEEPDYTFWNQKKHWMNT